MEFRGIATSRTVQACILDSTRKAKETKAGPTSAFGETSLVAPPTAAKRNTKILWPLHSSIVNNCYEIFQKKENPTTNKHDEGIRVLSERVNAKKHLEDEKKIYDLLLDKEKAGATKPKRKGLISEELDVTTLRDVQDAEVKRLSESPISNDFVLGAENIWAFQEKGGQLKRVLHGDEEVKSDTKYFALEVFEETVPCDLFCTVALDQIYPATLCLPARHNFTSVSPLMTAAMMGQRGCVSLARFVPCGRAPGKWNFCVLSAYNYDNLGEFGNHCTLVPKKNVKDMQFSSESGFPAILGFTSLERVQLPPAGMTNKQLQDIMSPKKTSQPEYFLTKVSSKPARVFPYLAAEFERFGLQQLLPSPITEKPQPENLPLPCAVLLWR